MCIECLLACICVYLVPSNARSRLRELKLQTEAMSHHVDAGI